jgi:dTDP-4-dehydrorhamnose 3,5-epimerase
MIFQKTPIPGAYLIDIDKKNDERGFFARMFCSIEFGDKNLSTKFVQLNNSFSTEKGVMRGMHYQLPPAGEVKVLRCFQGAIHDMILDLRPDSPCYGKWFGTEITAANRRMIYVPQGCAHGFITLKNDTEILYLVNNFYEPHMERGVRYNDPYFSIEWPQNPVSISEKDMNWPDFAPDWHGVEKLRGLI